MFVSPSYMVLYRIVPRVEPKLRSGDRTVTPPPAAIFKATEALTAGCVSKTSLLSVNINASFSSIVCDLSASGRCNVDVNMRLACSVLDRKTRF